MTNQILKTKFTAQVSQLQMIIRTLPELNIFAFRICMRCFAIYRLYITLRIQIRGAKRPWLDKKIAESATLYKNYIVVGDFNKDLKQRENRDFFMIRGDKILGIFLFWKVQGFEFWISGVKCHVTGRNICLTKTSSTRISPTKTSSTRISFLL